MVKFDGMTDIMPFHLLRQQYVKLFHDSVDTIAMSCTWQELMAKMEKAIETGVPIDLEKEIGSEFYHKYMSGEILL